MVLSSLRPIQLAIFPLWREIFDNLDMHFEKTLSWIRLPIIILFIEGCRLFPGSSKFGPFFLVPSFPLQPSNTTTRYRLKLHTCPGIVWCNVLPTTKYISGFNFLIKSSSHVMNPSENGVMNYDCKQRQSLIFQVLLPFFCYHFGIFRLPRC